MGNNIVSINEDQKGNIWIGTDDKGLNCFRADTKQFSYYFNKEEKAPDLRVYLLTAKTGYGSGKQVCIFTMQQKILLHYLPIKAGSIKNSSKVSQKMTREISGSLHQMASRNSTLIIFL
jgi:hypothetical protein